MKKALESPLSAARQTGSRFWSLAKQVLLPKSLLYRFVLIIVVPLILLQVILIVFFYDRHWETVSRRLAFGIAGEIQTAVDFVEEKGAAHPDVAAFFESMEKNLNLSFAFKPQYALPYVWQKPTDSAAAPLARALRLLDRPMIMQETAGKEQALSIQLDEGVLRVIIPRKRFFSSTVHVFLVWMVGSSILLFWIAFLFMKNQVRAIERLSRASELFGRGHNVAAFKPEGATEVKQAGRSFILMMNRIQKYLTERTALLAGVSHDLRTPLTRMKLQLSMTENKEPARELLDDINEMEQMLQGYLDFARGAGKEKPQQVDLGALLADQVKKMRKLGQKIDVSGAQDVIVLARPVDLARAVANVLSNAGRYAKRTQLSLSVCNHMAQIIADDNGPGIPKAEREEVFRAFYRLEGSRNAQTGGIGLGLTIARDIILSHGGDIALKDSPLGGLRVVITLPLAV